MTDALETWDLDAAKQVCLTTDNASNMVCATSHRLKWNHLFHFGHNLHLAVENSMKNEMQIHRALGISCKLMESFSHSWNRKRELSKAQERLKVPQHSLVVDCCTQWGSTEKMVSRILEQHQAIWQVLSGDRKVLHLIPLWQDIEVLESVKAAIGPLADCMDMLSGEECVTLSALNAVLHILRTDVLAVSSNDTMLTCDIKSRILAYIAKKYSDHYRRTGIIQTLFCIWLHPGWPIIYHCKQTISHLGNHYT